MKQNDSLQGSWTVWIVIPVVVGCTGILLAIMGELGLVIPDERASANGAVAFRSAPEPVGLNPDAETVPPVNVRFATETDEVPDFQRHVSPLLGRLGCNGRACHGSFQGQGGFRLSLFGYDFAADIAAMMEVGSGRIDLADVGESLILAKPSDADFHEGGQRFTEDSWQFAVLKKWIAGGAQAVAVPAKLDRLEVEPAELQFRSTDDQAELRVIAHWADGSREDVTPLCRFQSNDPSIATVTPTGHVQAGERGDSHLVVFYDNAVQPVPVSRAWNEAAMARGAGSGRNRESFGPIDGFVQAKLDRLGLVRSDLVDDATFLRRVCLDIAGTLPSAADVREFMADHSPDKRSRKIDELLETPAYSALWATFFCDLTGNNTQELRDVAYAPTETLSTMWYEWIRKRIADNMPYDQMVEGIVLASGRFSDQSYLEYCTEMSQMVRSGDCDPFVQGDSMPLYWMRRELQDPDERANSFAHSFLGLQIQCAQCHKHPFDQWTNDDFNSFARFFSGVQVMRPQNAPKADREDVQKIAGDLGLDFKKGGGNAQKLIREALRDGKTVPVRQLIVTPPNINQQKLEPAEKQALRKSRKRTYDEGRLPDGSMVPFRPTDDVRQPLMEWLRKKDNPWFARAIVNRIWAKYFGVGIVDPPDNLSLANPPSNAELLDWLASTFVERGYDLKWLHREIANSRTYQTAWQPNETNGNDRRNFSRSLPRRLPAEVVVDTMAQASASDRDNDRFFVNLEDRALSVPGTATNRAAGRNNSAGFALEIFGRSTRTTTCDCDRSMETSLIQTVYLQNDRDVHFMLGRNDGWVGELRSAEKSGSEPDSAAGKQIADLENRIRRLERGRAQSLEKGQEVQARKFAERIAGFEKQLAGMRPDPAVATVSAEERLQQIDSLILEAYLRALGRQPTPEERDRCRQHMQEYESVAEGLAGVLWALINSSEFIVNH